MARIAIVFCLLLVVVAAAAAPKKKNLSAIGGRIIGGGETEITVVPYQVSLHFNQRYRCGGSIIARKYVLTAAHCVEKGTAQDYSIRAGSKLRASGGVMKNVKKIIKHPGYNNSTINKDIAILGLQDPLVFNEKINAIKLSKNEPKQGDLVLLSGWGVLKENGTAATNLQSVTVSVVDKNTCKQIHDKYTVVTDYMFCAGEMNGGKGVCKGDSGGPAAVNGNLAGIVSWGRGCSVKNIPGVYTNIAKLRQWITSVTKSLDSSAAV